MKIFIGVMVLLAGLNAECAGIKTSFESEKSLAVVQGSDEAPENEKAVQLCRQILVDIQKGQTCLDSLLEKVCDVQLEAEGQNIVGALSEKEAEMYTEYLSDIAAWQNGKEETTNILQEIDVVLENASALITQGQALLERTINQSASDEMKDRAAKAFEIGFDMMQKSVRSNNTEEADNAEYYIQSAFVRDPENAEYLKRYSELLVQWAENPDVDKIDLGRRLFLSEEFVMQQIPYFEEGDAIQLCQQTLMELQQTRSRLDLQLKKEHDVQLESEKIEALEQWATNKEFPDSLSENELEAYAERLAEIATILVNTDGPTNILKEIDVALKNTSVLRLISQGNALLEKAKKQPIVEENQFLLGQADAVWGQLLLVDGFPLQPIVKMSSDAFYEKIAYEHQRLKNVQDDAYFKYQQWAWGEIKKFKRQKEAYIKSEDKKMLAQAMYGCLIPIDERLLDRPLQEHYLEQWQYAWRELDLTDFRNEIAEMSIKVKKKRLQSFVGGYGE